MMKRTLLGASCAGALVLSGLAVAGPASAAAADSEIVAAVNAPAGTQVLRSADPDAVAVSTTAVGGFPTASGSYLIMSTGLTSGFFGTTSDNASSPLGAAPRGADGNDLTQIRLRLAPPTGATCLAFDFAFLSEEFPEYVGSRFNDIFTAELNDSLFQISNGQVVAPNNFAYDAQGNPVSINTVFGMSAGDRHRDGRDDPGAHRKQPHRTRTEQPGPGPDPERPGHR